MSRTKPQVAVANSVNCKNYYFNALEGSWGFLPEAGEQFESAKMPLYFILLDTATFRITGRSRNEQRWSSTVGHQVENPVVTVKLSESEESYTGTWGAISPLIKDRGAKYMALVYAMTPDGELICLNFSGRNYSEFLNFLRKNGLPGWTDPADFFCNNFFSITGVKNYEPNPGEKTNYQTPSKVSVFGIGRISKPETAKMADAADKSLAEQLEAIFEHSQREQAAQQPVTPTQPATTRQLTQSSQPQQVAQAVQTSAPTVETFEDLPF